MNEINFNIEDIENINFELGVAIKKIEPILQEKKLTINENGTHIIKADEGYDALNQVSVTVDAIEDLTEELTTYNTELTEQEVTIEDIAEALKNKGVGEVPKYAPRTIQFRSHKGTELDYELNNLDTSNITSMYEMFYYCSSLTSLDLSNFDTSNITNMQSMFNYCSSLTSLDLSNFDTSNVTNMKSMFYSCYALTSLDLSNFDTSNITSMYEMFGHCRSLTSLDLSNFDTTNVTNMSSTFRKCYDLQKLDIRNFTFDKVTSYSSMFTDVPTDCEIIVKGDTEKQWVLAARSDFTNVKTVAELEVA